MQNKSNLLKYLKHNEIDSDKWNDCIENATNCRVYVYDWYLDRTAVVWDALIWGDYEYVMPLPNRKKFGFKYVYQPLFSQQLGIFPSPPPKVYTAFLDHLFTNFKYCDTTINSANIPSNTIESIQFIPRNNFLLPLNKNFETLTASFSKNAKRNINKAYKQNLTLIKGISLDEYITFKAESATADVYAESLSCLKSLIAVGNSKGLGEIYGVYTATNQLCAAVYFLRCKDRVIYYSAASNQEGKEQNAMYFLLHKFIEENTGKNLTLDFEGSMVSGIARFYSGFGAKPESYFQLKFNRLPLPLKWFKR